MATFLGVFVGFYLNRYWESEKKNEDRKDLLRSLRNELEGIEKKLCHANLLYPDIWESAVSSGKLLLLSPEYLFKLKPIYNYIEGIEYEAQRLRDVKEDFKRTGSEEQLQRWVTDSKIQIKKETELQLRIHELLQDKELWNYLEEKK
jgi:hypothetical protein